MGSEEVDLHEGQLTPGPITARHQATPEFLRGRLGPHNRDFFGERLGSTSKW
jgi:hypothetical protein